jgi:hypothetical protein
LSPPNLSTPSAKNCTNLFFYRFTFMLVNVG